MESDTFYLSRVRPVHAVETKRDYLVVAHGPDQGQRFEVAHAPVVIGRRMDTDLRLTDTSVSGHHCKVQRGSEGLVVVDLGSTNGTLVSGVRLRGDTLLPPGGTIQLGTTVLRHESRSEEEVKQLQQLEELRRAARYVESLLPARLSSGPVLADWMFRPSDALGGDAFGYRMLDDGTVAMYLLDVSGHGVKAALHSVSVLHLLNGSHALGVDVRDPAAVLATLNRLFPMENHDTSYFTLWYGVFDPTTRRLRYASGGHPPAALFAPDTEPVQLQTIRPPIGMLEDTTFECAEHVLPADATLFLYSDGCFEIRIDGGMDWTLEAFLDVLATHAAATPGDAVRAVAEHVYTLADGHLLEDDFSLVALRFPA